MRRYIVCLKENIELLHKFPIITESKLMGI